MFASDLMALGALGVVYVLIRDSWRLGWRENVRAWFVWAVIAVLLAFAVTAILHPVATCVNC